MLLVFKVLDSYSFLLFLKEITNETHKLRTFLSLFAQPAWKPPSGARQLLAMSFSAQGRSKEATDFVDPQNHNGDCFPSPCLGKLALAGTRPDTRRLKDKKLFPEEKEKKGCTPGRVCLCGSAPPPLILAGLPFEPE